MIHPAFQKPVFILISFTVLMLAAACSNKKEEPPPAETAPEEASLPPTVSPYDALPPDVRIVMDTPFTGDFDEMAKRRVIRVAVTFNRTHYFIDSCLLY